MSQLLSGIGIETGSPNPPSPSLAQSNHQFTNLISFPYTLTLQVDTGSSDTILPHTSLNNYQNGASVIDYTFTGQETLLSATYGDGSQWSGHSVYLNVTLTGTSIQGTAPVVIATSQSVAPQFMDGTTYQGLIGLAYPYPTLLRGADSLVHFWSSSTVLSKYQIAFHGCTADNIANSYVDFGNDTAFTGGSSATAVRIKMPIKSYFTVNIVEILIAGNPATLTGTWQANNDWSVFDSCTTKIYIPSLAFSAFKAAITSSGGLSTTLQNDPKLSFYLNGLGFNSNPGFTNPYTSSDFIWNKLPSLSFKIKTYVTSNSYATLTIGPKHYLQLLGDTYYFLVGDGGFYADPDSAILGFPLFSAFYIVADLENGELTFRPGCGSQRSVDGLPTVYDSISNTTFSATFISTSATSTTTTSFQKSTSVATSTSKTSVPSLTSKSTFITATLSSSTTRTSTKTNNNIPTASGSSSKSADAATLTVSSATLIISPTRNPSTSSTTNQANNTEIYSASVVSMNMNNNNNSSILSSGVVSVDVWLNQRVIFISLIVLSL